MFRKTKLKVEEKKKSDALTIISENTFVTGDMSSEGEIHFEGVLEGNIVKVKFISKVFWRAI